MAVNTTVLSGEIKRIEVNNKPAKKGPAAVVLVQYGPSRERTQQSVQFVNVAPVRLPPYVWEKCEGKLEVGSLVDIVGHIQGVLKPQPVGVTGANDGFITVELVADRLQLVETEEEELAVAA